MSKGFVGPRVALLVACVVIAAGCATSTAPAKSGLSGIEHVVLIYAENRSFDHLYGLFPGANGIANASPVSYLQVDRGGKVPTRDVVHRFYQNQEQINGGRNDRFVAASNAGALAMGYYDGSTLPLWQWAKDYVLADNFFMGAFGGSFLNHFWLVCACTPEDRDAPAGLRAQIDERGWLRTKAGSPASVLQGAPAFTGGEATPDGYSVNTAQPPWQPSRVPPAKDGDPRGTDPGRHTLPPQSQKTIGDTMTARGVTWAWYAGAWHAALKDGMQPPDAPRKVIVTSKDGAPYFAPHHQPFNYFARFAPGTADRERHLKDYTDLLAAIEHGTLPQVAFYKPQGTLNQHPGYTDGARARQRPAAARPRPRSGGAW